MSNNVQTLVLQCCIIAGLELQNNAMTSSDEISHGQTSQQLSGHQSSLDTMQLSSEIGQVSNKMQNLIQQIAAGSQASTQDQSLAESNKFNMQSTDQNSRKSENILLRESIDKNTESSKAMMDQLRVSLDAFKDKLSGELQQLKDQQGNQKAREENADAQQAALSESNQANQVAFTGGSPEQTQAALNKEHGAIADAATPGSGGSPGGSSGGSSAVGSGGSSAGSSGVSSALGSLVGSGGSSGGTSGTGSVAGSLGSLVGSGGSSGASSALGSALGALGRSSGDVAFDDHPLSAGWKTLTGLFSGWASRRSAADKKGSSAIGNNTLPSDGKLQKSDTDGKPNVSLFDDGISSGSGSGDGEEKAGFEEQGSADLNSRLVVRERR